MRARRLKSLRPLFRLAPRPTPTGSVCRTPSFRPRVILLENRVLPSGGTDLTDSIRLVGDVNGDGRADLVFVGQDWDADAAGPNLSIREFLSIGNGTFIARSEHFSDGPAVLSTPPLIADVNGDGRSDLIFRFFDPSRGLVVRTALGQPDGSFAPTTESVLGDGSVVLDYPTLAADVNGDGRADLIFPFYDSTRGLVIRTALGQPDGSFA